MSHRAPSALLALALGGLCSTVEASDRISSAEAGRLAIEQMERFKAHARELPPAGVPWFEFLDAPGDVLVTAPHATAQMREGKLKGSDLGTGPLAVVLHHMAGVPVLYTTWASPSDPNYYDENPFKERLAGLIRDRKPKLVLDLHASRSDRPYDVDLGTLWGASLLGQGKLEKDLRRRLAEAGIRDLSGNAFPGVRQATIVRFLHRRGVPCIQLEINARWLRPGQGPEALDRFLRLSRALAAFMSDLE